MAPLNYNPSQKKENSGDFPPLKPGEYEFKVDDASETVFKTGSEGLKAKLLVACGPRDVPCFVNMSYAPEALWKLEDFLDSLGLDFENPPDAWELVNKTGRAKFRVNKDGYFEVGKFVMPIQAKAPGNAPQAAAADDVPW